MPDDLLGQTLAGASFSLLCGPAIDRFGVRTVVSVVLFALSWIVLAFSSVASATMLLVLLILMRGFGQSALSVVSLTMIGKWFVRRLSKAMGVFSVLVSLGFVLAHCPFRKCSAGTRLAHHVGHTWLGIDVRRGIKSAVRAPKS